MPTRYPLRKASHASPRPRRFTCDRCHIKIGVPYGQCDDCDNKRPFIQYDAGIGDDRFYQMRRPSVSPFAEVREDKRNRRGYERRGHGARGQYQARTKAEA